MTRKQRGVVCSLNVIVATLSDEKRTIMKMLVDSHKLNCLSVERR